MPNLVLIVQALSESAYTADHIRHLLAHQLVKGEKHGRIWLVDLDDLKRYEADMQEAGPQKYDPTKNTKQ